MSILEYLLGNTKITLELNVYNMKHQEKNGIYPNSRAL